MSGPAIAGLSYKEVLGSGGYSDVYLYEQATPRRLVAVKILRAGRLDDAELAQFAVEAETMAGLADHPNIVQVFATGAVEDGRPFLVMQYYPGPNLAERAATSRYSVADVLRIGVKIASAVETAHRAGILHRDIKPANILVSPYGEPGLTDFGIAGQAADTENDDDIGVSVPWAPPEVLSGASNGSVASDVYSLGATLWNLLGARSPFEVPGGDNGQSALIKRILRTPPPATGRPEAPGSLERLLAQAMNKNPPARPRTALEFARALQGIEQEQRLARTELVIAGLGSARAENIDWSPVAPAALTGDSTRLRSPNRLQPQLPRPTSLFAPKPTSDTDTDRSATASPGSTARRDAGDPRTVIDGAPAAGVQAGHMRQIRQRADAAGADEPATSQRPVRPEAATAVVLPTRRGIRKPWAIAIAGVVIAAAVGLALVLVSGGDEHAPAALRTASGPSDDAGALGQQASTPVVTAKYNSTTHVLRFTFSTDRVAGDRFLWYPKDHPELSRQTSTDYVEVRTKTPNTTCLEVGHVVDGDQASEIAESCGG